MDYTLSVLAAALMVYAVALNLRALTWVTPEYRRRRREEPLQLPLGPWPWDLDPRGRRLVFRAGVVAAVALVVAAFATGVLGGG